MDNDIKPASNPVPTTPVQSHEQPVPAPGMTASQSYDGTLLTPAQPEPKKKPGRWGGVLSTLLVILIAPALALTITTFVFQSYEVDGQSMSTTLNDNDRLIIWKVPRTLARITKRDYMPKRGEVVVFVKRGLYEGNGSKEKQLIKRVLALPGERITINGGAVTVYNAEHPNGFNPDSTLPYGKVITSSDGDVDVTVSAREVFVVGDNRGNSLDSRYFGAIPAEDIVGQLAARILPISEAEKF